MVVFIVACVLAVAWGAWLVNNERSYRNRHAKVSREWLEAREERPPE